MYIVKESSTNQANKNGSLSECPVTYTLAKIGGRWKVLILYQLTSGPKRYGEIRKGIPGISEKMLIEKLKELEADKLIHRAAEPTIPPKVTYRMAEAGLALGPILNAMADWGRRYVDCES